MTIIVLKIIYKIKFNDDDDSDIAFCNFHLTFKWHNFCVLKVLSDNFISIIKLCIYVQFSLFFPLKN